MQQSTDQDTSPAAVEPDSALEEPADPLAALGAYLGHRPGCVDCTAARRCETARDLWAAYKAATSTS